MYLTALNKETPALTIVSEIMVYAVRSLINSIFFLPSAKTDTHILYNFFKIFSRHFYNFDRICENFFAPEAQRLAPKALPQQGIKRFNDLISPIINRIPLHSRFE